MTWPTPVFVRVLVLKQGDQWLAQGLEFDLATQAPSDKQAIKSFVRILRARCRIDLQHGRAPLADLPQAPERFHEAWQKLEKSHSPSDRSWEFAEPTGDTPPAYVIHSIANNPSELGLTR